MPKKKKNPTQRYSGCISITRACHARLKAQARREGTTIGKIVERAVEAAVPANAGCGEGLV